MSSNMKHIQNSLIPKTEEKIKRIQNSLEPQIQNIEHLGKPYKQKRYYTPEDVEKHFHPGDLWVVKFNKIYDLSKLVLDNYQSRLTQPLIDFGGKKIDHWFNPSTGKPKTKINPQTGTQVYHCPNGRYLHIPANIPGAEKEPTPLNGLPWWEDESYVIGRLTQKTRKLRIINMLTHQEHTIQVPCEETIEEIEARYRLINDHAPSYTWKSVTNKPLDMDGTLDENDIFDETDKYEELGIPEDEWYVPPILLFFDDDLTEG